MNCAPTPAKGSATSRSRWNPCSPSSIAAFQPVLESLDRE